MRILQITPGTGNFHCGSCLRDHALVQALTRLGHQPRMVALYLPWIVDDAHARHDEPIFFGGVNVYLQQHSALFRHAPRWLDRLVDAPALLRWAAQHTGMTRPRELGEITVSMLRGEHGHQHRELDKLIDWLRHESRPDVCCLSNALLIGLARRIRRDLGVPVVCTLQGEDTFLDGLPSPQREQAWQTLAERAADVDAFIPVSRYHADIMQSRLDLPADRVHVVHNGIPLDGHAPADAPPVRPTIGYLSRMCPTKGLHTLVDAFIHLHRARGPSDAVLHVAGTQTPPDVAYVGELQARLQAAGLADKARFEANISRERKLEFLRELSVLSVPATYGESFGLYVLEALASGVPVVQPRHGAFPELLERTGGGVLYDPDSPAALAAALADLLTDADRRQALARQGREAVLAHYGVDRMAREVLAVYDRVLNGAVAAR